MLKTFINNSTEESVLSNNACIIALRFSYNFGVFSIRR